MFKDRLKQLRIEKGITQKELAENIFVSRSTIAKWENGNGVPSNINLETLCKYFDVDNDYFFKENDNEININEDMNSYFKNKYIKYILTIITIIYCLIVLSITYVTDSTLVFVIGLILSFCSVYIYYFIRYRKISLRINENILKKRYDECLNFLKKEIIKSIHINELYYIYEHVITILMIKGEEQKVLYILDAYPKLKKRKSLSYILLVLSVAKNDKNNIDFYYNKVQNLKNKIWNKHKNNAKLIIEMINTNTFNEELYNNTNLPLIKHICENIRDKKENVLVDVNVEKEIKKSKQKAKLTVLFNIISIISIWVGLCFVMIINNSNSNLNGVEGLYYLSKSMCFMYLAIPLPLSALIYGIVKVKNYKTKSCIILGIIFTALLIIYGSIGFAVGDMFITNKKYITYIEEKTSLDFPDNSSIIIYGTNTEYSGYIRFNDNYEEYIIDNSNFIKTISEEYRTILSAYDLTVTAKYNYFFLEEIEENKYIFMAYSIEINHIYFSQFIIENADINDSN